MRIAVIEHAGAGDYAEYIYSLIDEKAKENNYQIKTWSNSVPAFQQQVAENAVIYIYFESRSPLILNWLYNVKIPSILKKTKASVVIDLNGMASAKIKIPQLLAAAQFFFDENAKQQNSVQKFAFKHAHQSVKIADDILAYSDKKLNEAIEYNKEKLHVIPFTAPAVFKTFEWHDKIMPKAQYADNNEYFVAVIEDNNVNDFVLLLQAFSKFKKWQQSSMRLLVLAKYEALGAAINEKYKSYRHRTDVQLIENIEEIQVVAIIASAHSLIHVFESKPHLLIISIALQCGLPIISFTHGDVKEYAGTAAVYSAEKNAASLGDTLIQLYKDENLHAQLKEEAQKQSLFLKRKDYENKLWQLLKDTAHS